MPPSKGDEPEPAVYISLNGGEYLRVSGMWLNPDKDDKDIYIDVQIEDDKWLP